MDRVLRKTYSKTAAALAVVVQQNSFFSVEDFGIARDH